MAGTTQTAPAGVRAGAAPAEPSRLRILSYQVACVAGLFALWELAVRSGFAPVYLYGQPSGVFTKAFQLLTEGDLLTHLGITAFEAITGFILGTALGSSAGLALWLSDTVARTLRPIIVAINGVPKIALAPLIIVWFGVGLGAKVAIATSLTFIVALITVYQGTQEIDNDLVRMMRSLGAKRSMIWRKVIVPGSVPWIMSTLRLNIGFAMIGAVVGEYISAKQGIGFFIYNAGALYDLNAVYAGIFGLMALALLLDYIVMKIEAKFKW
jgi:NitT/TauT family transport system permease protein